jgi:DNA-binding MarR family transcriptional regulator
MTRVRASQSAIAVQERIVTEDRQVQAQAAIRAATQAAAEAATEVAELISRCGFSFDRVAGLTRAHDSEWLSLDLGMGPLKAMMMLAKHQQMTVGGIARALNLSEPSASLLVDKLVNRSLAVRATDPADRRRTLVLASEEGAQLVERLRRSRREQFDGWLEQMASSDLRALTQGLDALAEVIGRGSDKL